MSNTKPQDPGPSAEPRSSLRLLVAGLAALLMLVGVGLVYYWADWQNARSHDASSGDYQKVYQRFLEDIEADRLDAAYQSTTTSFQRQTSRATFEERVRRYLAFKRKFSQVIEAGASGPAGGNYRGPNQMIFTHVFEDKDRNRLQASVTVAQKDSILYRRPPPPQVSEVTVEELLSRTDSRVPIDRDKEVRMRPQTFGSMPGSH